MGGKRNIVEARIKRQRVLEEVRKELGLEMHISFRIADLDNGQLRYHDLFEPMITSKDNRPNYEKKAIAIEIIKNNYGDNTDEFWEEIIEDIRIIMNREQEERNPTLTRVFDAEGNVVGYMSPPDGLE